jgi:predicted transglutaminase-like cysteine proteinase
MAAAGFTRGLIAATALFALTPAGVRAAHALPLDTAFAAAPGQALLDWRDAPRWSRVIARAALEQAALPRAECGDAGGEGGICRLAAWSREIQEWRHVARGEQMVRVNYAVNRLAYVSDSRNWGEADRWETPLEMIERGGDCEGFALTKYFALRDLGFDDSTMRIAVVWDTRDREEHAVLLVLLDGGLWLLDNKLATPVPAADYENRYRLIYSANQSGVSLAVASPLRAVSRHPRVRLADGGRSIVLRVTPRRERRRAPPLPMPALRAAPALATHVAPKLAVPPVAFAAASCAPPIGAGWMNSGRWHGTVACAFPAMAGWAGARGPMGRSGRTPDWGAGWSAL